MIYLSYLKILCLNALNCHPREGGGPAMASLLRNLSIQGLFLQSTLFSKINSIFLRIFLGELYRSHLHMSPYTQVYQLYI